MGVRGVREEILGGAGGASNVMSMRALDQATDGLARHLLDQPGAFRVTPQSKSDPEGAGQVLRVGAHDRA